MRFPACRLLLVFAAISAFSQAQSGREDSRHATASTSANTGIQNNDGIELLKRGEAEAAALQGQMRAWVFWQIGIVYETRDRGKSLDLFDVALTAARAVREDSSVSNPASNAMMWVSARPVLSPGLRLQADIARSIVLLQPERTDQIVQQIDPAARSTVLLSVLASQEKEKQFDRALETLNRITAQDEMPYGHAMRLMDTMKAKQSLELIQIFFAALRSYRDHAPHAQFRDEFAVMLARYWKQLPKEAVHQGIDEVLKQALAADEKGNYSVGSEKGTSSFGSLYEYRLSQIMPMLREFDASAAHRYLEKYPALVSSQTANDRPLVTKGPGFHPSSGYSSIMLSMAEMPAAQKAAGEADNGHPGEALSDAAVIADVNLRAQVYEYIARLNAKKQDRIAPEALENMLEAAGKLTSREGLRYYSSAAGIYMQIHDPDAARKSIETGLEIADKLYLVDSDDDDPNTALKAFWPSTNAFCTLLREAARISPDWAISLLGDIKDPEIRVAAETALAGGWLNAPIGPSIIMTTKKSSNSISFSGPE